MERFLCYLPSRCKLTGASALLGAFLAGFCFCTDPGALSGSLGQKSLLLRKPPQKKEARVFSLEKTPYNELPQKLKRRVFSLERYLFGFDSWPVKCRLFSRSTVVVGLMQLRMNMFIMHGTVKSNVSWLCLMHILMYFIFVHMFDVFVCF